jgi:hypothetical protein
MRLWSAVDVTGFGYNDTIVCVFVVVVVQRDCLGVNTMAFD